MSFIAVDLGASSGRVALGRLEGQPPQQRLSIEILHRFPNGGVPVRGGLYWDVLNIWREILHGLKLAAGRGEVASVGVNTWGVDYGLVDKRGELLGGVRHYRDSRTDGVLTRAFGLMPRADLYAHTGIQLLPINTAFQLLCESPTRLESAHKLLMTPDLFHFWLSGKAVCERTIASTSQMYDPRSREWSKSVLDALNLPANLLPEPVPAGTDLGPLTPEVSRLTNLSGTQVIAPAAHDTASAVAAVPAEGQDWAFVSSGTWTLVGLEVPEPVLTPAALAAELTNEAGANDQTLLMKNGMGLWLLQQCDLAWKLDYADLYAQAAQVEAGPLIDPEDARFAAPGADMPQRVQAYCLETQQTPPQTPAEITRCIVESLAQATAKALTVLEEVSGKHLNTVHIVGGGSQIALLNQRIADLSGKTVMAGPVEATLIGNLLIQAQTLGYLRRDELRGVVRRSETVQIFEPAALEAAHA
ncbi:rhamnulokinase [Deinococcus detaillensis]|uniref:rhamnulokinase n=1 Tax=Deinococcus detaillensis TaxID=2592048 RepID=UPI001CDD5A92|nr:rhamnulokinase family protein [Deinococcus detaillensis]